MTRDRHRPRTADRARREPTLRRDAARNRDKILAAARAAFDEEGVDVGRGGHRPAGRRGRRHPLPAIPHQGAAHRGGGVRGAGRRALGRAVGPGPRVPGRRLRRVPPGRGLAPVRARRLPDPALERHPRRRAGPDRGGRPALLARAQEAGAVRPDLVYEDVVVLFWSPRGVIEATATVSPEAWLRHLDLLVTVTGPGRRPLRHPPLTARAGAGGQGGGGPARGAADGPAFGLLTRRQCPQGQQTVSCRPDGGAAGRGRSPARRR